MTFINELEELKLFTDREVRKFKPIPLNEEVFLSIQASALHYSKPEVTTNDLKEYTHWELCLFRDDGYLRVSDVLPTFSSLAEIELYYGEVYSYVPADLVEELFAALK